MLLPTPMHQAGVHMPTVDPLTAACGLSVPSEASYLGRTTLQDLRALRLGPPIGGSLVDGLRFATPSDAIALLCILVSRQCATYGLQPSV